MIDHGNGRETIYGHLETILVRNGETVAVGETIGTIGESGLTTGSHVHYEMRDHGRVIDPALG